MSDTFTDELDQMIEQQRRKRLELAKRLDPTLTEEDLDQPHDWPALAGSWHWNYEDGVLAGLLAAQLTLRRIGRK